jgi:hypothetical protein
MMDLHLASCGFNQWDTATQGATVTAAKSKMPKMAAI